MATYRSALVLVVFFAAVSGVLCSVCLPDTWEGKSVTYLPARHKAIFSKTAIDVPGQKTAMEFIKMGHHHHHGPQDGLDAFDQEDFAAAKSPSMSSKKASSKKGWWKRASSNKHDSSKKHYSSKYGKRMHHMNKHGSHKDWQSQTKGYGGRKGGMDRYHGGGGGCRKKLRVVTDYKEKKAYIIVSKPGNSEVKCFSKPVERELKTICLPEHAREVANITLGGSLECSVYSVRCPHAMHRIVLTSENNIPVSVASVHFCKKDKYRHGPPRAAYTNFFNITGSVSKDAFDLPPECKDAADGAMLGRDTHHIMKLVNKIPDFVAMGDADATVDASDNVPEEHPVQSLIKYVTDRFI